MIINEITQIREDVNNVTVFYGGRFQPAHQGHRDVYKHLTGKFGLGFKSVLLAWVISK